MSHFNADSILGSLGEPLDFEDRLTEPPMQDEHSQILAEQTDDIELSRYFTHTTEAQSLPSFCIPAIVEVSAPFWAWFIRCATQSDWS